MDALLTLIPGGSLTATGAAIVAALVGIWRVYAAGRSAGRDAEKAKGNDAYERHLEEIAKAGNARADADRLNADPERLRQSDGHKRK